MSDSPIQSPPSQAINRKKWTPQLMRAGWTVLPNVIIEKQAELGLDPIDINIVLHLAAFWWDPDIPPRPSKARMAQAMNVSPRTLQRRLARMDSKGLVRRIVRGSPTSRHTNSYDLSGLIEAASPLATEMSTDRAIKRKRGARFEVAPGKVG